MVARWPEPLRVTPPGAFDLEVAEGLMDILGAVRTLRAEMNIPPSQSFSSVFVRTVSAAHTQATQRLRPLLQRLARVEEVVAAPDLTPPPFSATHTIGPTAVYLPLTRAHLEKERDRLGKEIGKSEAALVKIERKLASDGFVAKAPPDVVAGVRAERDGSIAALSHLREQLERVEATLAGG